MRQNKLSKQLSLVVASCLIIPSASYATNALFLIGNGAKSRAMGGAGIAHVLDSLSAVANPAAISGMDNRFDIGMDFFKANVESQLGSVSDESVAAINGMGMDSIFLMPAMGITYQWDDKITLGFAMTATGGGGTKFETNFYEAASTGDVNAPSVDSRLGVDYVVAEMAPSIAFKVNDTFSLGVSYVIGVARFEAYGLDLFSTFTPSNTSNRLSDNGKDWSVGHGLRVGALADFGDITLGFQYTSKIWMSKFDLYSELFAEGGRMNVPANLGVGASFKATSDLSLAADITYTFYEDTPAIGNLGPNLAGDPSGPTSYGTRELGTSDGMGFGWKNQAVIKLGAEYQYSEKTVLRAGWNYGKSPINENREIIFNLLAPATVEHHLTLGSTYAFDPEMEINVSYVHAFEHEQSGPTYISDDGSNSGRFKMSQDSLGLSLSMKY